MTDPVAQPIVIVHYENPQPRGLTCYDRLT